MDDSRRDRPCATCYLTKLQAETMGCAKTKLIWALNDLAMQLPVFRNYTEYNCECEFYEKTEDVFDEEQRVRQ